MPEFKTIKQIEAHINKLMREALNTEVAKVVKNKEQEMVVSEVYDKYSPSTEDGEPWEYERRGWKGGLADQKNMKHKTVSLGTGNGLQLSVENKTKGKDDKNMYISDLIEGGDGYNGLEYNYKSNRDGTAGQYLKARPYQQKTVESLEQSNEHVEALKKGLIRQGLDVTIGG
jgi:hypothetical protein